MFAKQWRRKFCVVQTVHETLSFVTLELAPRRCLCQLLTARERLKLQAKETVCRPPVEKIQKLNQKRVEATLHPEDYMQYDNADEHKGSINICVRRRKCAMKKAEAATRGSRLVWLEETTESKMMWMPRSWQEGYLEWHTASIVYTRPLQTTFSARWEPRNQLNIFRDIKNLQLTRTRSLNEENQIQQYTKQKARTPIRNQFTTSSLHAVHLHNHLPPTETSTNPK